MDIRKLKQEKLKQNLRKRLGDVRVIVDEDDICLYRDNEACIKCGRCKEICEKVTGMTEFYGVNKEGSEHVCIGCGQCTNACGTNALREKASYREVFEILNNYDKVLVVSTAPAVRVALAEEFGYDAGRYDEGIMITALRMLGFDYVFDVTFGADLTVMEEASELIKRITKKHKPLPMFSSCCPAWIRYLETFEPKMLPHISTAKSPISMQGTILKTYFAREKKYKPENIVHVVITPCTAKKFEATREELSVAGKFGYVNNVKDVDYVLTTRELAHMIRKMNIPYGNLDEGEYDKIFGRGSGGGVIFGSSGGVTEAVLREAHFMLTGNDPSDNLLKLEKVRGLVGVKEDEVNIDGGIIKVAVVNGIRNAHELLQKIKKGEVDYDFVEVMSCFGGCIGGGGQPKTEIPLSDNIRSKRIQALYAKDEGLEVRCAHKNPQIRELYDKFLGAPLSDLSKELLHTTYQGKSFKAKNKKN
jgi:ferredoxin hydrogenase